MSLVTALVAAVVLLGEGPLAESACPKIPF